MLEVLSYKNQTHSFRLDGYVHDNCPPRLQIGQREESEEMNQVRNVVPQSIPIRRLPNEILIEVFDNLLLQSPESYQYFTVGTLLRVCSIWNAVVKATPSLWSTIDSLFPIPYIAKALILSQNTPLTIVCRPPDIHDCIRNVTWSHTATTFLEMILPHAHRWKKAEFSELDQISAGIFPMSYKVQHSQGLLPYKFLSGLEVPRLESLVLGHDGGNSKLELLDLFDGQAPRLQHLVVHLPILWSSSALENLRTLHVSGIGARGPSPHQLLDLFTRNSELEELELRDWEHSISSQSVAPSHDGPISLPKLRKLRLKLQPSIASAILSHVAAPSLDALHIEMKFTKLDVGSPSKIGGVETFLANVFSLCPKPDSPTLRLTIAQREEIYCSLQGNDSKEAYIGIAGVEAAHSLKWVANAVQQGTLTKPTCTRVFSYHTIYLDAATLDALALLPDIRHLKCAFWTRGDDGAFLEYLSSKPSLPMLESLAVGGDNTDTLALLKFLAGRKSVNSLTICQAKISEDTLYMLHEAMGDGEVVYRPYIPNWWREI